MTAYRFDPTRLMLFTATAVMWLAVASTLHGVFDSWPAALVLAAVVTWLFTRALELLFSPLRWFYKLAAGLMAVALATITIALSGSALWAKSFANASLTGYFERHRVAAERHLSDVQAQAQVAQRAVTDWAAATASLAELERTTGGSCPRFAQSVPGQRGPVYMFRSADQTVAASVQGDLNNWTQALDTHLAAFKAVPVARSFADVKTGIVKANAAIEAALPLTQDGAVPSALMKSLDARLKEPVARLADGTGQPCGDAARDQLITKAHDALQRLNNLPRRDRIAVPVDLNDPRDVVTRGWLRASNLVLAALPGVAGPHFKDDVLWKEARERQGLMHTENLPFLMVGIVELSVAMLVFWTHIRPGGQAPFSSQFVRTVQAFQTVPPRTPPSRAAALRAWLGRWVANLLYSSEAPAGGLSAGGGAARATMRDLDGGEDAVQLPNHPAYGDKTVAQAMALLPFYVDWGNSKHLIIPRLGDRSSERAHAVARYLSTKHLVRWVSASASVDHCQAHPSASLVLGLAAPRWQGAHHIEVWALTPRFAAFLDRLALGASGGQPGTPVVPPVLGLLPSP
jgi:hypothetical protein